MLGGLLAELLLQLSCLSIALLIDKRHFLKAIKANIKINIFNFGDTILDFNKKINENKEINKINEDEKKIEKELEQQIQKL